MGQMLREVNAPYTVNADDEAIGRETIIIRRNGVPVAALVPFAEYQALPASLPQLTPAVMDSQVEREWAAFQKLLPELLKTRRGQWVAIVDERPAQFGPDFQIVIVPIRKKFGQRPICVQDVLEQPRVHKILSPRVVRS